MRKWFVFDEDYESKEEASAAEDEINKYYRDLSDEKESDDYSFNGDFNFAIEAKYYKTEVYNAIFLQIENSFDVIYRYYHYTKRYIAAYEKQSYQYYKELSEEAGEPIDIYNHAEGELADLNCESTLIMVYSAFEAFLRTLISYIDDRAGILKRQKDDNTTYKYLKYLKKNNIFVPKKLYWQFNEIRLVRNYYAHSLDEMQEDLKNSLKREDPYGIVDGDRILVNVKYIEHVFEVLGKVVKSIEKTFVENYPDL